MTPRRLIKKRSPTLRAGRRPREVALFRVEVVDFAARHGDIKRIRETVFVREQRVPLALEWDGLDPECRHVLAVDRRGRAVGTGRLTPEHHIGRMAVVKAWRGKGVGSALLLTLVQLAREQGLSEVALNAQTHAMAFYAAHGFRPVGAEFEEAGIPHHKMVSAL